MRVRLPPRASRARVAQRGRGGRLKPGRLRVRVSPRALAPRGCMQMDKAACPSNRRPEGFAGSSPATPVRHFHFGRSSNGRAPRCERGGDGFDSRRPTHFTHGALAKPGLRHATLYRARAGSNPARPAKLYGAVAEWPGTGLSIQTTRVRVSSAPPAHARCKLNRHEHPPLKRGAAGSSPARRIHLRSVA